MLLKYVHIKDESVQVMLGRRRGFDLDMAKDEFPIGWHYAQGFGEGADAFYSVHESFEDLMEAYKDQFVDQTPLEFKELNNNFYGAYM